jgi:penicillin-binding protein 1A
VFCLRTPASVRAALLYGIARSAFAALCLLSLSAAVEAAPATTDLLDFIDLNQVRFLRSSDGLHAVCYCGIRRPATAMSRHAKAAVVAFFEPRLLRAKVTGPGAVDPLARALSAHVPADRAAPGPIALRLARAVLPGAGPSELAALARTAEARFTLDELIGLYLNRATFAWRGGSPVVGIEQAARLLFGRTAAELSLVEAARLVAMLSAPAALRHAPGTRPGNHPVRAVLTAMATTHLITPEQSKAASAYRFTRGRRAFVTLDRGYFIAQVRRELAVIGPLPVEATRLVIFVGIDDLAQHYAEHSAHLARQSVAQKREPESAVISLDRQGRIEALVGGRGFKIAPFDRAIAARRQPGSTFKLFVFLAAIEHGYQANSLIVDAPFRDQSWGRNHDNRYFGRITLARALAVSANSVARRLAERVGIRTIVALARRLGVTSALRPDSSLPLGTSEVALSELTAAYAAVANGGFRV